MSVQDADHFEAERELRDEPPAIGASFDGDLHDAHPRVRRELIRHAVIEDGGPDE